MDLTRREVLATTTAASAAALAGCGGDGSDDGTPTDETGGDGSPTDEMGGDGTPTEEPSTVQVYSHDQHGDVLVGPDEGTLYNFEQDTQDQLESACYEGCEGNWPPLTVDGEATAGDDVNADLETFERDDGETQVAANGWPLYYYAGDSDPGDANGQGLSNGNWWVMDPDGMPIRD